MFGREIEEGFTFDDLLLVPAETGVLPKNVDTVSYVTRNICLAVPLISAAMDTVTESATAIAMAQSGGMGIIHKNLSAENQATEVRRVKRFESGIIFNPITIEPNRTLKEAVELRNRHHISGFPVVLGKKLVGIITDRDIRAEKDLLRPVCKAMTPLARLITLKEGGDIKKAKGLLLKNRIEKLPIVNDKGELKGLITLKDIEKESLYPNATKDKHGRLRTGAAVGVGPSEIKRASALIQAGADCVVVDTAHGHSKGVIDTVKSLRHNFRDIDLIAGNIATSEAAEALIKAGVDAVKVGMGPGSICTTRVVAGVGMPQITAIMKCAEAVRKKGICLIADGGIKYSGDITKAIAAGADAVMIGSLFAGTDEVPGEIFSHQGKMYKIYRGMGSVGAMSAGSKDRYSQEHIEKADKLVPEGVEGRVSYSGKIADVVHQLVGGLRAGMGYVGCASIKELKTKTKFVRITPSGLKESHVHDVLITKEAPNYRVS